MHRVEVAPSKISFDSVGQSAKGDIEEDLGIKGITSVRFSELYYLDFNLPDSEIERIASKTFVDPLAQNFTVNKDIYSDYDFFVEVKLHTDVTDNVGIVAMEGVEDFLGKKLEGKITTARRYYINGKIDRSTAELIGKKLFANEIIETFTVGEKQPFHRLGTESPAAQDSGSATDTPRGEKNG